MHTPKIFVGPTASFFIVKGKIFFCGKVPYIPPSSTNFFSLAKSLIKGCYGKTNCSYTTSKKPLKIYPQLEGKIVTDIVAKKYGVFVITNEGKVFSNGNSWGGKSKTSGSKKFVKVGMTTFHSYIGLRSDSPSPVVSESICLNNSRFFIHVINERGKLCLCNKKDNILPVNSSDKFFAKNVACVRGRLILSSSRKTSAFSKFVQKDPEIMFILTTEGEVYRYDLSSEINSQIQGLENIVQVVGGVEICLFLSKTGEVFCTEGPSYNKVDVFGIDLTVIQLAVMKVKDAQLIFMRDNQGKVFGFRLNDSEPIKSKRRKYECVINNISQMASSCYSKHILFLKKNGDVFGMGDNSYSQLGKGTKFVYKPKRILDFTLCEKSIVS